MTAPGAQALQLHLLGVEAEQIARRLQVTVEAVPELVGAELAARQPGMDADVATEIERVAALWRKAYAEGIKGDLPSSEHALRLSQHLQELRSHARTAPEAATPAAGIRDAWGTLALGAHDAAATLLAVARNGRTETQRVRAAQAVLSRVGISERVEVAASVRMQTAAMDPDAPEQGVVSPGDVIRQRLAGLRAHEVARLELEATIDAELPD